MKDKQLEFFKNQKRKRKMRFETEYLLQKRLEILDYEAMQKRDINKKPCGSCKFLRQCVEQLNNNPDNRLCMQAIKEVSEE